MKILFLGDYSGLHACMARGCRERGHDVTLISDGGRYMLTDSDILLDRRPGKTGSFSYLAQILRLLPRLRGYDVVHLINPHFLNLRPAKIKWVFRFLRRHNRLLLLTLAGNDYIFCKECLEGNMFEFSEFRVGNDITEYERTSSHAALWTTPEMRKFNDYVYANIDGAIAILPEYDMAARPVLGDRLAFVNLPIDLSSLPYAPLEVEGKLRFFVGMKREMALQKGTGKMLDILQRLALEYPDRCEVECVSNLPLAEYLVRMRRAHVVIDQLYAYSPATNALQAMAQGKVSATGAMPEYYDYINRDADNSDIYALCPEPVLKASPTEDMEEVFRRLIVDPSRLSAMSRAGRMIVERHNALPRVVERMEQHWHYLNSLKSKQND